MPDKFDIYKCDTCGKSIEVLHVGEGDLVCCREPMERKVENTFGVAKEKHVPVIERNFDGIVVVLGSIPHPMETQHYIEWIELIVDNKVYRQILKPGDKAEASFSVYASNPKARAYCNLHGLWDV
jgi:superoxide reductase